MLWPQANSSYLQFIMTCSEELVHRHERAPASAKYRCKRAGRGCKKKKKVTAHAAAKRVPAPANTVPLSELVNTFCKWAPDADVGLGCGGGCLNNTGRRDAARWRRQLPHVASTLISVSVANSRALNLIFLSQNKAIIFGRCPPTWMRLNSSSKRCN